MAKQTAKDPFASIATPISNASPSVDNKDPFASISEPLKKKDAMDLSVAKPSMDGSQEEDGWFDKLKGFASNLADVTIGLGKGAERRLVTGAQGIMTLGSSLQNPYENMPTGFAGGEKYKLSFDQRMKMAEGVNKDLEKYKFEKAKGSSQLIDVDLKDGIDVKFTAPDAEAFGEAIGDNLTQLGLNMFTGGVGVMVNFAANFENNYQEARKQGIPADRALGESAVRGGIETYIEKKFGLENLVSKGIAKQGSKEAIKQITESVLTKKAFDETAKKAIGILNPINLAVGFAKGFVPEAAEEFVQTVADNGAQQLFNYYETKRNEDDPNAKSNLYKTQDENGNDVPVEAWSKQTLVGGLNAAIYGGIMGQAGATFINSRSFNPTIYSTLQNSYESTGKKGLTESKEDLIKGVGKALANGKIDQAGHDNAMRNIDLMEQNITSFNQGSEIPAYTRYQLFNIKNNVVPEEVNQMALQFAKAVAPVETPTADAINNDIESGNTTEFVVPDMISNAPQGFAQFIDKTPVQENGQTVFKGMIPNSLIQANQNNTNQIQSIAQEASTALASLTDNERIVSVDDIKRLGQQGSPIFKDAKNQLAFEYAFQKNEKEFQRRARRINLLKSVAKDVETNQTAITPESFQQKIENLYKYNVGDSVFFNNKSAKILDISNDGQKLKLSGVQEQISASDNDLRLEDSLTGQAVEPQVEEGQPVAEQTIAEQPKPEAIPLAEEEQITTGRTMRDAVEELIPFTYRGETGEIYKQGNGVVVFESPNRIYEFGNIRDIADKSIDEFDIIPQEMEIGNDFSVTIDGKKFTNKSQNPFKAITYDADGNAVSIKLDDKTGKTKVIKGTRAMLIDAKYKIKQLFDESTRDQLAAAADDAARQAATAAETARQSTETATTAEGKPTEQAPSIAEQERAKLIREIAAKLVQEESQEMTENKQAIASLSSSLFSSGIKVEVLDTEGIRTKYGKQNVEQGMFLSKDGVVVINESMLPSEWGKTVIFHEGTHPIINIIRNTEPKLYNQLVAAAKEESKTNPEVNKILQQIKTSPSYKGEFTQNDEFVVELIARVASGKLNLNDVKPTLRQAIIDFINKIAKVLGLNPVLNDTNQVALNRLATQISNVLNTGRDISEIVGAENVSKFANESTQFRVNEVFDGILEQLGISAAKESKKGITNYGVASALNKYYNEKFNKLAIDDFGDNALKVVSDYATDEVIFAMQKFGDKSGKGWYTEDFAAAVDMISEVYPAIKEKEDVREIATIIISIASNSTDVSTNLMRVIYGLETYQKTGKIPSDIGTGKAMSAIATTINRYNRLLETFDNNPVKLKEFLQTIRPISESKKAIVEHLGVSSYAKVLSSDYATNPDWDDAQVLPTSIIIFGPKIGAFYSNLSGLGGTPTIDRWCIRTMFRYRGDMRAKVLNVDFDKFIKANNLEGQSKGNILALAESHAKLFDRLLGGRGVYASLTKEQRNAEMSKYRQGKSIYSKSADVVNDIKDGLTDDIKNKTKFAKDFRTFTKETFEKVQDNILETTGEKLDISDIQAILWIFEKNLFGFLGVKQREDSTYSAAANRIVSSINNGNVSLESVINGTAKLADMKLDGIIEEGAMGDQYLVDDEDFKNGIDSNKGDVNIEEQLSDLDRTYTPETTVADAGMTMKERKAWQEKNRVSQRQERNPIVQKSVENLRDGLITLDNYINVVRVNMPIFSMPTVPKIPTFKEIVGALNEGALGKAGIVGLNKTFADGERVASRLDIPAYNAYDTWVVSIHEGLGNKPNGKVLGYGQTAVLKNVNFGTSPLGAINIAIDKDKATIARIYGDWVNESPEAAHKRATELMNDPAWTQVGMNPYRHSFFYDKNDGTAVVSADEVIQVGALVLAKNVVKAPFGSQAFIDNFSFKNKLGETIQFSDINRDDKRIQFVRNNLNNYSKSELTEGLMEAFAMSREDAQRLVDKASADQLTPSLPKDNVDTSIPEGAKVNEKSSVVDAYNEGYDKAKKSLLDKAENLWEKTKKEIALQYDSKFYGRRNLAQASSQASLAQSRLRNLNGIAYSAGQELSQIYNDIFGNGLQEQGERKLNLMIFNLRILQVDKNTERQYQDEIEKLTVNFIDTIGRMPSSIESASITRQARTNVPVKKHGKTLDGRTDATSQTAEAFLDALRLEIGQSEYDMLMARADMYRKVGNEQVIKLRDAGIISKEIADTYKDDFYSYRKTLDRLYGEQDMSITMLNGVSSVKGWAALSKEGTENFLEQDARLLLAESYIGTARAIAKNKLREAIFDENIKTDENGIQSAVIGKNGQQITFMRPANYLRDNQRNIRSNGKQLSVNDADEGFVNVPYKKDGVINYYQMEAEMFKQIEGNNIVWKDGELGGTFSNIYYNTTDWANRQLTGFATRNNPVFWIGNISMDLQQQVFFTDIWTQGSAVESNVYSAGVRALARAIKFSDFFGNNKDFVDKTLQEYIAAGGAMDRMSTMKEQRQRSINIALVDGEENKKGKWLQTKTKAVLSYMNEKTEIAMRLAAFDQSKKNLIKKFQDENGGANPNESDMLKIQEIAAAQSRAYTDFAQRGTSLPNLNIAYLNSSIQAAGAAAEYIADNKGKTAAKLSQLVVGKFLGTMAIMALMGDAYDELDEYRKDLYSFLFAFDTKIKDANGNPIFVTADIKNNPSLVPFLGVTRTFAEMTMRQLQGKEQKDIPVADRFFDLLNVASPIPIPNVTSVEGIKNAIPKIISKHVLANAVIKGAMNYDSFRDKQIESDRDQELSPYMRGQDDPNIPYFYKAMARSMANNTSQNQISPKKMQAVAETFITAPSTNILIGLGYGVLSEIANKIIPAKSEGEFGENGISGNKLLKTVTKRFATFTDAEKAEFRRNEELYKMSKEESMRYNDIDKSIDTILKNMYKADSKNFFTNVDKMAKESGYWDSDQLMERIDRKANLIDKNALDRSYIKSDIANEVRILHYTKGAEGKAKLIKYMYDNDVTKARQVIDGLIDYGTSSKEAYETEDLYNELIKKK